MIMSWKRFCFVWIAVLVPFALAAVWLLRLERGIEVQPAGVPGEPLRVVVLDPLCRPLVREELRIVARDYTPLGGLLEQAVGRPVALSYGNRLADTLHQAGSPDLILGQEAAVLAEAAQFNESLRPLARLTDDCGATDLAGVFLVREAAAAKNIGDMDNYRIVFGPPGEPQRHAWALAALSQWGIAPVPPIKTVPTGREALQMVAQNRADAAVLSSFALALLEDEDIRKLGPLRVVGRTEAQPFITAFATARIGPATEQAITTALLSVRDHPPVLEMLRSKAGFVPLREEPPAKKEPPAPAPVTEWTDWRGPDRAGMSPDVPARLPATVKFLWKRGLTGASPAGIAATATHVIVADKNEQKDQDIWRCLDADTGKELWTIAYATPTEMEFTNAPRATPVIHGGFAYLLGAFGDLHCVSLYGNGILWRKNIVQDFGARLPAWGTCSTPLVVDDSLVVSPGATEASLAALGLYTGEVLWKTPGAPAAYGSLILGTFGGVRQIVGHDAESLGGWDPNTGQRLWTLKPDKKGDYNVPTPVNIFGRLLVATENNGTRLHNFTPDGQIRPAPVERSRDLAPDTATPVVVDGLVFGCARGLVCLDLNDGFKTLYSAQGDGAFKEHAALIAGYGRVLAVTVGGEVILFQAARDAFTPIGRLRVFEGTEVWSHPALVGDRLYLRSMNEIVCLLLSETP